MCFRSLLLGLILSSVGFSQKTLAEDIYQPPEEFLNEAFAGHTPEPQTFWITKELRPTVNDMMEHNYPVLRTKYWQKNTRTVWILEEIGKVKPITTGIVIDDNQISHVKILIYRESHGWEVRYPAFTDQFKNAELTERHKLNQTIDNISGATMSVDAIRNLGKLALFLHKEVMKESNEQ